MGDSCRRENLNSSFCGVLYVDGVPLWLMSSCSSSVLFAGGCPMELEGVSKAVRKEASLLVELFISPIGLVARLMFEKIGLARKVCSNVGMKVGR